MRRPHLLAACLAALHRGLARHVRTGHWAAAKQAPDARLYMPRAARSRVAQFCVEYSDFWWEDCGPNLRNTTPGALELYAEACEASFEALEPGQRELLEPLLDKPMEPEVRTSWMRRLSHPFDSLMYSLREQLGTEAKTRRDMPQENRSTMDYVREVLGMLKGGPPEWMMSFVGFEQLPGKPVPVPKVEPSEVLPSLQRGRIVRFDAARVLPSRMFNVSIRDIAELHRPEEQLQIPYRSYGDQAMIKSQGCLGKQYDSWRSRAADAQPAERCGELPSLAKIKAHTNLSAGRINVRRLPRYMGPQDSLVQSLGLGEVVQRDVGNVIIGESNGGVHWDEPDNIFIALAGVNVIFLVPAEYSPAAINAKCTNDRWDRFMQQDDWKREALPYHFLVMHPGDAVVIPSGALHAVYGDRNRLALNTFMEPKFNRMRWPGAPVSWWHRDSQTRLALRNLWIQSVGRVWDAKKVGLFAQGLAMEML